MAPAVATTADAEVVIPPKDAQELELEKLVFGDLKGFENNLKKIDNLYDYSSDEDGTGGEGSGSDSSESGDDQLEAIQDDQLFFVDDGEEPETAGGDAMDVDSDHQESSEDGEEDDDDSDSDAVWHDSDDEKINVSLYSTDKLKKLRRKEQESVITGRSYVARLRSQFEKIYPRPEWVDEIEEEEESEDGDGDEDEDGESSMQSSNALLKYLETNQDHTNKDKSFRLLPQGKLDISRLKDANFRHPSKSAIQTMSFHQTQPLLLTGGYDRTLRVYHVDGKLNNMVTSLHLRNSPVQTASFQNSNKIFAGGRRKFMYKWDIQTGSLEKISRLYGHESTQRSFENFKISPDGAYIGLLGNSGWINVLNGITGQWIKGFKVEGTLTDIDFTRNSDTGDVVLVAVNSSGDVWEWNVQSDKILSRWRDESGLGVTRVRVGGINNKWIAIGNNVGIVNVYDRFQSRKSPVATVENLVTTISSLEFSPDGQMLCVASRAKKDALRLVHIPSFKVFSNWPTSGTPLGRVTSVCFSPDNELICVGNEAGKVRMWKLNHY